MHSNTSSKFEKSSNVLSPESPSVYFTNWLQSFNNRKLMGNLWNISLSTFITNLNYYLNFTNMKENKIGKKTSRKLDTPKAKLKICKNKLQFLLHKYEIEGVIPTEEISKIVDNYC